MSPRGNAWYFFVLWVARHIALRLFSGGLKIIGRENIPKTGPVILAPNHVSNFDPPVVSCGSPRCVVFLAKEELFKPPIFGLRRTCFALREGECAEAGFGPQMSDFAGACGTRCTR